MARVKVKLLDPGQHLLKDAVNANGRLLLKAGTLIEENHLEVFRTWGIVEVDIVSDEPLQDKPTVSFSELPSAIKDRIYQKIKRQFNHCDLEHPLVRELVTYQKNGLIKEYFENEGDMV